MPYFQPVVVGDQSFPLDHLEPFTFSFMSLRAKRQLRVHVTFTNHCFSTKYDPAVDADGDSGVVFPDHGNRLRRFCEVRYRLSLALPAIVAALNDPRVQVSETAAERNWCHTIRIEDPAGPYYVFFEIRRAGSAHQGQQDLNLVVESAYHQDPELPVPALKGTMGFQLLCGKVYLGERTSTRR